MTAALDRAAAWLTPARRKAIYAALAAKVDALTASPVSGTVTVTGGTLTVGT